MDQPPWLASLMIGGYVYKFRVCGESVAQLKYSLLVIHQ